MKDNHEQPIRTAASIYPPEFAREYRRIADKVLGARISVTLIETPADLGPLYNTDSPESQPKLPPEQVFDHVKEGDEVVVITAPPDVAGALNREVKARVAEAAAQDEQHIA
jgi:hypothetical protein